MVFYVVDFYKIVIICFVFFFVRIRRPPRATLDRASAASDVYKRQSLTGERGSAELSGHEDLEAYEVGTNLSYGGLNLCGSFGYWGPHETQSSIHPPPGFLLYTSPGPPHPYRLPSAPFSLKNHTNNTT